MKVYEINNVKYYIGKNAKENDELYNTMPANAVWFHLDSGPSAHVYAIEENSRKLTKIELKQGAVLVRKYSKSQSSVIYTYKKNIKLLGQGLVEILDIPKKI